MDMIDYEIIMLEQFIDVLEVLESYKDIGEIKSDIYMRKKLLKEQIRELENKKKLMQN